MVIGGLDLTHKSINANKIKGNSRCMIYKWTITGGLIGALSGSLLSPSVLTILGIYKANTAYVVIVGAFIGSFVRLLLKLCIPQKKVLKKNSYMNEAKIKLRKEELELYKHRVKTGEVKIHKEIVKEEKNIMVPIIREELVIEKKEKGEESEDNDSVGIETIRIPIKEERIEVTKSPVMLEDVSIFKQQIQGTQHIDETVKREKLNVGEKGKVNTLEKKIKK